MIQQALREFPYPTAPSGVSDEFRNRLVQQALKSRHAYLREDQP
jgi:hypothetical protein